MKRTAVCCGLVALAVWAIGGRAFGSQKHKLEEPAPLPPQLPMALRAETAALDFHLSRLLAKGGLAAQIHASLTELIRNTKGETIVKLRAFVAGAGDARRVQTEVSRIFTDRRLPLPVLSVLQVGALGQESAKVVIEAVVDTRRAVNPDGLAFFAGQNGPSLEGALARIRTVTHDANVEPDQVLRVTCFAARMSNYGQSYAATAALFPHAAVNLVQALRDPPGDEAACEAIGRLAHAPAEGELVLWKEKRVTLLHSRALVFTGLQLSFGNYLDDAHEAFVRLGRASSAIDPVEAPVQVNVFSLDSTAGAALRKTTSVPPSTFSVQTVEGLPSVDATAGIEAVLAPNVASPAAR